MNFKLIHLPVTDSTSRHIQQLISEGEQLPESTVLWADYQTKGRGQASNTWESDENKNLTFSILFYPDFLPITDQFYLSQAVSLGIADFLSDWAHLDDISIKWPNDIYYRDKKICGILIENLLLGNSISYSVAGIGLNVNQKIFHSDAPNPVSMTMISGKEYSLSEALEQVVLKIQYRYLSLIKSEFTLLSKSYFSRLYRNDGFYPYEDESGSFLAKISSIKSNGILNLMLQDGAIRSYAFKEVKFVLPK